MEPLPPRSPRIARKGEGSVLGIMHDIFGTALPALADAAEDAGVAAVLALAALMASMSIVSGADAAAASDACGPDTRLAPPAATVAAVDRSASRRFIASPDNAAARGNKRTSGVRQTSIMYVGN